MNHENENLDIWSLYQYGLNRTKLDQSEPNWTKQDQHGPDFFLNKRHFIDSQKKKKRKKFEIFFFNYQFFVFNLNDMLRVFIRKSYVRVQICLFFRVSFMIFLAILVVLNV